MSVGSDCMTCARLDRQSLDRCEAFPRGVPVPILTGEQRHIDPVEGDRGIVWAPRPGFEHMDVGPNRLATGVRL